MGHLQTHLAQYLLVYGQVDLIIARVDDVAHLEKCYIQPCPNEPEREIMTKLHWLQIFPRSMDTRFCMLIGLAVWFEYSIHNYCVEKYVFQIKRQNKPELVNVAVDNGTVNNQPIAAARTGLEESNF